MTPGKESPRRAAIARFAPAILLAAATLLAARSDAAPRGVTPTRDAPRARVTESRPTPPTVPPAREARPSMPRSGGATGTAVLPGTPRILSMGLATPRAAGAGMPPAQIASYPVDGQTRVPANAELYFVFDQATSKRGSFSVADLDSNLSGGGALLLLNAPRWSALGDTVFLKPTFPMEFGHAHGMRVNTIVGPAPDSLIGGDQPIVFFSTIPRASLERVPSANDLQSVTLVAGSPTPVAATAREKAGTAVTFTAARIEFWAEAEVPIGGPTTFLPLRTDIVPAAAGVPRFGVGRLVTNVTVPRDLARATGGRLGLRIVYEGTDETGLPFSFEAISRRVTSALGDTTLAMTPAAVTPRVAGDVVVRTAALEWPLPGAAIAAGDTIRPRAVVTGDGTGPFRAAFIMDGDLIGIEEGFMESGRPVAVTLRGPLPTRRFGEHRLQFVVEAPQGVAAQPVTFLCVPPANGLTEPPGTTPAPPAETGGGAAGATGVGAAPPRFALESTWLADARSAASGGDASLAGWAAWRGRYDLAPNRRLEATMTNRIRVDDTRNGSATPEQLSLRYVQDRATVEWGDLAPSIANGAPLLASPVPRRGAQATWTTPGLGTLEGFLALESRPRSAGGPLRDARSDLYAVRLTRAFGKDRLTASLYGGYTHEDPTPGGEETATRARAIYGGSALLRLRGSWTLLGDAASVRHRTIAGVEPGRTRTAARAELNGVAAGFAARAEAFRYQPDLATALNPYALSDRKGFDARLSRPVAKWRFFGGYRSERPEDASSGIPDVKVARMTFGGTLRLNQESTVTPSIIRITQKGDQTDFKQTRLATEFTESEPLGGRTTARFDVGFFEDGMGLDTKRILTSGSLVTVRRHPGRLTSTITAGYEENQNRDLDARDLTFQGSMELGWEAVASRFLVAPFVSYATRDYELEGTNDRRLSVRLQLSLLRLPALGDAALSISGHADRVWLREPSTSDRTDTALELSLGKRIALVP